MQCLTCGTDNPAGNRYCGACGTALTPGCPNCGAANPAGQRFCGECGSPLGPPSSAESSAPTAEHGTSVAPPSALAAIVAERRVCSVLFCDLVGFTALSETKDPEDVRELLSRYFAVARTVIGRYGGVVEKFIGDAVMAVWGTPTATEEDAERAVRAGLDLVDAVAHLGAETGTDGLCARAGVVTGPVAVTVGAAAEGMVAGDAVNTAARVQAAAKPGAVYVDEGTWRVARAAVAFTPAGDHIVKGKSEPMTLWRAGPVLSGVGGAQRHDGLEAPFVGRDTELRLVKELFHACADRKTPRLVSVTGVAGVGKSRLGWEFEKYIDGLVEPVAWHRGRCLSYGDGVAFWALAEMVRQRLGIGEEDRTSVAAEKLATGVEQWFSDPAERTYMSARLGHLLGIGTGSAAPTLPREELFAGWRLFFERLAGTSPVVLLVEDLQNADPGFLDFLEHLLDWAKEVPIFILTFARPDLQERRPGWGAGRRNGTTMTLDALDQASIDALLDGLVPAMPAAAKAAVAVRAEGVPLYAVETVRMLIDRDVVQPREGVYRLVGDVGELGVPATLQSLLAARLDALEPAARSLVADAAVLGSSFAAEALVAVSGQPAADVHRQLAELLRREVLGVRADPLSPEQGHYGFVQTMFRQVAYDTLARRERKARHLAVAAHLESAFAESGDEISEVIAAHLLDALGAIPEDADIPQIRERAVAMLRRAAERADRTGAPAAAAAAYSKAADLLGGIGTDEAALEAAAMRERAGVATGASGDPERALVYLRDAAAVFSRHGRVRDAARVTTHRAEQLRMVGKPEQGLASLLDALTVLRSEPDADTVKALEVLAILEPLRGNEAAAERASAEALALAQDLDLPDSTLAHLFITRGIGHGFAGHVPQALANVREGLRRAEGAQDSLATSRALLNLADTLMTVSPREAAEASRTASAQARRTGSRYVLANAACNMMQALLLTGDWDEIEQVYTSVSDPGDPDDPLVAYGVILLRSFRGDTTGLASAVPAMARWQDGGDPQDAAEAATALAAAAACRADHAEALDFALRALAHVGTLGPRHDGIRWAWVIAVEAALALDRADDVSGLLDWLDELPPGQVPAVLRAERLRFQARLESSRGGPGADAAYERAVQALRDLGSPFHLAVGLLDFAAHRVAVESIESASLLLAEARAIALGLGAPRLVDRAGTIDAVDAGQRLAAESSA